MTSSNIRSAVVVGLGAAGTELARRLADAGIATTGVETDREAAGRARRTLGDGLAGVTATWPPRPRPTSSWKPYRSPNRSSARCWLPSPATSATACPW